MKITHIKKLRECGIFRNFVGDEIPKFGKFNLIYGQNGSGKTTLSKILRNLELRKVPEEGEILIVTDELGDIRKDDFLSTDIPIHVFNSDFVKDNVFPMEGNNMPPIIILGSKDKKKVDELEEKRDELTLAKDAYILSKKEYERVKQNLDEHCKSHALVIKKSLEGPGEYNNYGNYDKRKYRERAKQIFSAGNKEVYLQDKDARNKMSALQRTAHKTKITEPTYSKPDLAALRNRVIDVLAYTLISERTNLFVDDPERAEWMREGLAFQINHKCPFCKQQVPKSLQLDLERYFSTEHEQLISSLDQLKAKIYDIRESHLPELTQIITGVVHDHLIDAYKKAQTELSLYYKQISDYLDSLESIINRKKNRPSDTFTSDDVPQPPDDSPISNLVSIIHQHNNTCENYIKQVIEAGEFMECQHVAESLDKFECLENNVKSASMMANESKERVDVLKGEVAKLESEISDHSRSAAKFNIALNSYLGHNEMHLEVHENGYAIARKGGSDPLPSEGEKTAIALLYFLTTLLSDEVNIEKSIIVLDDPISSLDANSLFAAYGFIRERTNVSGQLFILTHSFTFFREVRDWFKNEHRKNAQFYMLNSISNAQGRYSTIQELDPLLKDYNSDYHYLFARVWHGAQQQNNLEFCYPLPNMARRLLEAFLAFHLPESNKLRKKMEKLPFNEDKKRRIIEFLDANSHKDVITEQGHDTELLSEIPNILQAIIDLIQELNPQHYKGMMKLIQPAVKKPNMHK